LSGGARYVLEHVGAARVFRWASAARTRRCATWASIFPRLRRPQRQRLQFALEAGPLRDLSDEADPVQAIQVLAVRYLLTKDKWRRRGRTYPLVYSDAHSYVYENKQPLPRAFVVHQAVRPAVQRRRWPISNAVPRPRQTVVLESEPEETPPPWPREHAGGQHAEIVAENPQHLELEASLSADSYLVLLDTFYPGWTATVDGQPPHLPGRLPGPGRFVLPARTPSVLSTSPGHFGGVGWPCSPLLFCGGRLSFTPQMLSLGFRLFLAPSRLIKREFPAAETGRSHSE